MAGKIAIQQGPTTTMQHKPKHQYIFWEKTKQKAGNR